MLLVTALASVVAMGLSLLVSIEHMAAGNHRDGVRLAALADGGLDLAAHELALIGDWSTVLGGAVRSTAVDGAPTGSRRVDGVEVLDLEVQTNLLNCGQRGACSAVQLRANTRQRPWGANNPVWRLFAYGPPEQWATWHRPALAYVVVWVADDEREQDGDAASDGAMGAPGRHVVRVRADTFGRAGGRRSVEADVVRPCPGEGGGAPCRRGARVQGRREARQAVP